MIFRYMLFQYQKQRLFYGVCHRKRLEWTSEGMSEDCDLWAPNGLKTQASGVKTRDAHVVSWKTKCLLKASASSSSTMLKL